MADNYCAVNTANGCWPIGKPYCQGLVCHCINNEAEELAPEAYATAVMDYFNNGYVSTVNNTVTPLLDDDQLDSIAQVRLTFFGESIIFGELTNKH